MQFSNFDLLPRPASNCDFLHLCRLKNLRGTLAGELYMGGRPMDGMIGWGYSRYCIYDGAIEFSNFLFYPDQLLIVIFSIFVGWRTWRAHWGVTYGWSAYG